jgi:AraC family transcriptional regulator
MDLITELNQAIEYIEDNLESELQLKDIAKITSYSPYHFQRIFNYISGISLSEYLRRRRLSVATFDLQNGEKVIDVAMKYGYVSADSFSRAFVKQHGITPSQFKSVPISMELYPPMYINITVNGLKGLSCRIETKEAFNMFGMDTQIEKNKKTMHLEMKKFLQTCVENKWYAQMNTIYGYEQDMMLHRAFMKSDDNQFTYMICQYMKDGIYVPDNYGRFHIPAGQWAIFHSEGEELPDLWDRIYSEWLPNASYEINNGTAFEMYFGNAKKGNIRGEIMIPIQEKKGKVYKANRQGSLYRVKEDCTLSGKYRIEEFIYGDQWNEPLGELYQAVSKKYPKGIYWSYDPRSNEGKHVFICLDEENRIIGKSHAMIYEKQEDDAPGYAEHRIFIHYRVLPEYEKEEEALDLLYESAYQCALELRKQLSNRACQICIGNFDFEESYNKHIEKKDWPEYESIYHLSAKTKGSVSAIDTIENITLREFSLASMDIIRQLVENDQICFRDTISSASNYLDTGKGIYFAYGAFVRESDGKERLVGSVVTEMEENSIPEITGVMVLPEYRRKHLATTMIQAVLAALHIKGYKRTWLVCKCVNKEAVEMYQKEGFSIYSHEKRYMKYI